MIYAAIVRQLVRRSIDRLNAGDPDGVLGMASPKVVLRFPGDNLSARIFRPVVKGRLPHDTHIVGLMSAVRSRTHSSSNRYSS